MWTSPPAFHFPMPRASKCDEWLAYDSVKVVSIKDWRLGAMRLFFMLAIFSYVVVKVLIIDHAYNIHDSPLGVTRISLEAPKSTTPSNEIFCPQHPDYYATPSSWPYPLERKNENVNNNPIACQTWDPFNVRYPADELDSIFITTRVSIEEQLYHCGQETTNDNPLVEDACTEPYQKIKGSEKYFFLAGVSNYTLGVQSSFYAPSRDFSEEFYTGNSREKDGKMKINGEYKYFPMNLNSDTPDIISVQNILDSAGLDLSGPSKNASNSIYYSGAVVLVKIHYTNGDFSEASTIKYEYSAQAIKNSDYKFFETRSFSEELPDGTIVQKRTSIKRAGIRFVFIISGDFFKFNAQNTLIQLVTALGLLSFSTFIVESLMLYIMKWKKHYRNVKYENTRPFSSLQLDSDDDAGDDSDDNAGQKDDGENLFMKSSNINNKRESGTVKDRLLDDNPKDPYAKFE